MATTDFEDLEETQVEPATELAADSTEPVAEAVTAEAVSDAPAEQGEQTVTAPAEGAQTEGAQTEGAQTEAELAEAAAAKEKAEKDAKEAENKANMEAFYNAVKAVMVSEDCDKASGDLPTALIETVTLPFSRVTGAKNRKLMQEYLLEAMQTEMAGGPDRFPAAKTYLILHQTVKGLTEKRETIVHTPVDPTEAFVAKVAALVMAPNLIAVPANVTKDWEGKVKAKVASLNEQVATYRTWLLENADKPDDQKAEAPKVDELVLAAARVAVGRSTPGRKSTTPKAAADGTAKAPRAPRTGDRGDIGQHIAGAFDGKPVGTFLTVGEIVKHVSADYPAGSPPSSGAVSARLFPKSGKCTVPGIEGRRPEDGAQYERLGGLKVAEPTAE